MSSYLNNWIYYAKYSDLVYCHSLAHDIIFKMNSTRGQHLSENPPPPPKKKDFYWLLINLEVLCNMFHRLSPSNYLSNPPMIPKRTRLNNIFACSSNQGTWLNWDCILETVQVIFWIEFWGIEFLEAILLLYIYFCLFNIYLLHSPQYPESVIE